MTLTYDKAPTPGGTEAPLGTHPDSQSTHPAPEPGPAAPLTGIVVNHTHWDREWYLPFQRYRVLLVDAIDLVLHTLASQADYAGFMLAGQTVVAEAYLE